MDLERWRRAAELFTAACALPTGERRPWVEGRCPRDGALCHQVLRLLTADRRYHGVLDAPPGWLGAARIRDRRELDSGDRLGAYRLLREIGSGGSSRVWLAVKGASRARRRVAIKLLRWGAGPEMARRLRRERRILALLDHPHIARGLAAGRAPDGRPFLVLEYVPGLTIGAHCERERLDTEARLRLFLRLCSAVEHVHERGLVHRDLKPANVLVTVAGAPKLLDFGIAEPLSGTGRTRSGRTYPELRLLTPSYASPEQIRGEPLSIASDIYSLGVLLHELLTGDPQNRPCAARLAGPRGSLPDGHDLSPGLGRVILRALASDPGARQRSVGDLAAELRRHLRRGPTTQPGEKRRICS